MLDTFATYCGMGTIAGVFAPKQKWEFEAQSELKKLLTREEFNQSKNSILNAYYTPPAIARAMWQLVEKAGFQKGNVLSVSAGTGMFTMTSPELCNYWTLIEQDPITAEMLRHLYPKAKVYNRGFHKTRLPNGTYDLFIDNVPFGDYHLSDLGSENGHRVHAHAILKGIEALRPGGIACVIVTSGISDAVGNEQARYELMSKAHLKGVFRLPSCAFKAFSNTKVTTDILLLQKREERLGDELMTAAVKKDGESGLTQDELDYIKTTNYTGKIKLRDSEDRPEGRFSVNSYVSTNRTRCLLGCELVVDKTVAGYRLGSIAPAGFMDKVGRALDISSIQFDANFYHSIGRLDQEFIEDQDSYVEGSIVIDDDEGIAYLIENYRRVPFDDEHQEIALDFYGLKQVAIAVIDAQKLHTERKVKPLRSTLNDVYDSFVKKHGKTRSRKIERVFTSCIDLGLIQALEDESGNKTDIFYHSTVRREVNAKKISSICDAYSVSLNEIGGVCPNHICWLLGHQMSLERVHESLVSESLAMYDVDLGVWMEKSVYLSGDVVTRLQKTLLYKDYPEKPLPEGLIIPDLSDEVAAKIIPMQLELLENIQPLPCMPDSTPEIASSCAEALGVDVQSLSQSERSRMLDNIIEVKFGASWFSPSLYAEFFCYLLFPDPSSNSYYNSENAFKNNLVQVSFADTPVRHFSVFLSDPAKNGPEIENWQTSHVNFVRLVESMLALRDPKITEKDADGKTVVNIEATEMAKAKAAEIRQEFNSWIWSDEDRAVRLCALYNRKFNRFVERKADGQHLSFSGMAKDVELRDYQSNAVWRVLTSSGTLLAHSVGLGKTLTMIASIMEGRRFGFIHKPVIAGLKSTIPQLEKEFRRFYPHAKLLVANPKNWELKARRRFLMQAATGDWDCIIMSHQQFCDINLSPAYCQEYINEELARVETTMSNMSKHSESDRRLAKRIESRKNVLQARLDKVRLSHQKAKMATLTFEQIGFDALFLDESQVAKNLGYSTTQHGVKGVNPGSDSAIAQDINMKCRFLLESNNRVIFSTGTPISNSIGEMFTLMRHLIPQRLSELNLDHFDTWSTQFTRTSVKPEISSTGVYKVTTRLSEFVNIPELMQLYRSFADIKTQAHADISRPFRHDFTVEADPSPEQSDYVQDLLNRASNLSSDDRKSDNMLKITNDGRANSLDPREVDLTAENFIESKVNKCIINAYKIWEMTKSSLATQAIFCDMSTPGLKKRTIFDAEGEIVEVVKQKMFNVYDYVRETLVSLGIPKSEIAFIHDYSSQEKKRELFERVNRGEVRIILGSTVKLGTGVNIQSRLVALHHLDAPYRPSDLEQRDGRGERYGNMWSDIMIFTYITRGSNDTAGFDSYLFQLLEAKARVYSQVMVDDINVRSLKDDSVMTLSFSEVKALASGNPLIKEKADLESKIQQLTLLERAHGKRKFDLIQKKNKAQTQINEIPQLIDSLVLDLELFDQEYTFENFSAMIVEHGTSVFSQTVFGKAGLDAIYGAYAGLSLSSNLLHIEVKLPNGCIINLRRNTLDSAALSCEMVLPNSGFALDIRIVKNQHQLLERVNAIGSKTQDLIFLKRRELENAHHSIEAFDTKPFARGQELSDAIARLAQVDIMLSTRKDDDDKDKSSRSHYCWQGQAGRQSHEAVFISDRELGELQAIIPEFDGPWFDLIEHQMRPGKSSASLSDSAKPSRLPRRGRRLSVA